MSHLELVELSALVGTGLPVVAAVLKQDRLGRRANTVIAAGLAMVVAFGVTAAGHELTAVSVLISFTATYTTAVAFYHGLWKPTGVAPAIQRYTSLGRRRTLRQWPVEPSPSAGRTADRDLARC
jgi:hypothetical protein